VQLDGVADDVKDKLVPGCPLLGPVAEQLSVQAEAPPCVTDRVLPAIEATPVRADVDALALHSAVTVEDPEPLRGETVSHDPFPLAVHPPPAQPDGAPIMAIAAEPAALEVLTGDGTIEKVVQVGGGPPA
jgi:hypothetical protein